MIINKHTFLILLVSGVFGVAASGCKKSGDAIIARSGSIKITKTDFQNELANSPVAYQNYLSTLEGKKQFLDILLREKILLNEAQRSGIIRKKEIQKNLIAYKERIRQEEIDYRKNLILREFLRDLQDSDLKVTESEMKLYFEQNSDQFMNPVKVTASHILSTAEPNAQTALTRLKKGEDFAKLAQEVSADPSSVRGGLIGEVVKGDLSELPEFEEALFKLRRGEISGIVHTKLGYHIIKKNNETPLPKQSFEGSAPRIRRTLEKNKFDKWIDGIKKNEKLWIDEKLLAELKINKVAEQGEPNSTVE